MHYKVREIEKVGVQPTSAKVKSPPKPQPIVSREKSLQPCRVASCRSATYRHKNVAMRSRNFCTIFLNVYHFNPRPSFRIVGEQIDGASSLNTRYTSSRPSGKLSQ